VAHEFVVKAKNANEPMGTSAIIKLEVKLDKLQLKGMRDFYNDVVGVLDKYKVTKTDQELCMLMAWKNNDTSYARLILDELKSSSPDFDGLCNSILEIQRLTKSGTKRSTGEKEVHLASIEGDGIVHGKMLELRQSMGVQGRGLK